MNSVEILKREQLLPTKGLFNCIFIGKFAVLKVCYRRFKSSEILHCVDWKMTDNISNDLNAVFSKSNNSLFLKINSSYRRRRHHLSKRL